ncbi:amidohydrolase family protein [Corallococcus sp. 4LFB]|uniref:amidohydrolase family protein n=1 Tax=Corallococcus sp. 4LFB TaxID=3383249 RepID=UPI0039759B9D
MTEPHLSNGRYVVVTSDGHAGPPARTFRDYLEKKHWSAFDDYLKESRGTPDGKPAAAPGAPAEASSDTFVESMKTIGLSEEAASGFTATVSFADASESLWDPARRLAVLEKDGVVGDVIFPDGNVDNEPPFGAGYAHGRRGIGQMGGGEPGKQPELYPVELVAAGARAYNRWLSEFCATNPGRHAGVAILPTHDVGLMVEEVKRAHASGLTGGVLLPLLLLTEMRGYNDPIYEPLWSVCEDLGMPVNVHAGGGQPPYGTSPDAFLIRMTELSFYGSAPLWYMMWGGVFERHPKLKVVFTEQSAYWAPQKLAELDFFYDMPWFAAVRQTLRMKPSEYWARQCYVGTFMFREEAEQRHAIGLKNILWGSDFPHLEGTWPHSKKSMQFTFSGMPSLDVSMMVGGNAIDVYNFDRQKLAQVAAKVGPLAEEVNKPLTQSPPGHLGMGFRYGLKSATPPSTSAA